MSVSVGFQVRMFVADEAAEVDAPLSSWQTQAVVRRFERAALEFDARRALLTPVVRDTLYALARIRSPSLHALDIGCGGGMLSAMLRAAGPPWDTWQYTGLETTTELVGLCRRSHPSANFIVGRAESLPCRDRSFDVVICSGVIQYVSEHGRVLDEVARVSCRWAALLRTPVLKHHATVRCVQEVQTDTGSERHTLTVFNREELLSALRDAGMTVVVMDYTDEVHHVEGLDERVFHLNFLLQRANGPVR